jgi:GxxExxY protein
MNELLHQELSNRAIKSFYKVYNTLGFGFLEKVYENALMIELRKNGIGAQKQKPISVYYENELVGEYFADIMIENSLIIELKAAENIIEEHECQLINYLKATEIEVGLLFNFGKKPEIRRKIFTNDRKKIEHG